MIIYKRPTNPDDHMQKASPSRLSFAKGWPILMINCKAPVVSYDHLQNPAHPDGHLQKGNNNIIGSIRGPRGPKKVIGMEFKP